MEYKVKHKLGFTINRCLRTIGLLILRRAKTQRKGTLPGL